MQKKTIFFDIDGTLLDCWHNKPFTIPNSNRQALQLLKQQGHQIIACTGRHEAFLKKYFPNIFESYITMNGSHIVYQGDIIYDRIFSHEEVSYLMKHFDNVKARYAFIGKVCAWCRNMDPDSIRYFNRIYGMNDFAKTEWNPGDVTANSLEFMFDTEEEFDRCKTAFDGSMILNRHRGNASADLAFVGNDKGTAIRLLTKHANIDLKDTIAFGDGNNDVSMLKLVHCGIAMGNGTEEAKQAADFVTDSIFDDGIYKALIRLNLANPPIPKANGYKNQTIKNGT